MKDSIDLDASLQMEVIAVVEKIHQRIDVLAGYGKLTENKARLGHTWCDESKARLCKALVLCDQGPMKGMISV